MVLGGQSVSRIRMNLRGDNGDDYSERTSFDFRGGAGPFVLHASVQSEATADAVIEAMSELRGIRGDRPVTAAGPRTPGVQWWNLKLVRESLLLSIPLPLEHALAPTESGPDPSMCMLL